MEYPLPVPLPVQTVQIFFELFRKKNWFIQILFIILAKINSNAYIIVCIYMYNLKVIKTKKNKKINFFL